MSYEEKDWIMRQIKQIAIGLGRFLGKDSVKEMINMELSESEKISDEDLDDVLLLIDVEDKLVLSQLKESDYLSEIGMTHVRFNDLLVDYSILSDTERKKLKEFVDK